MNEQTGSTSVSELTGSHDGTGAGDHDAPFGGFRTYHFSLRQQVRLLQLRSELLDARLGHGRWVEDLAPAPKRPRSRSASA